MLVPPPKNACSKGVFLHFFSKKIKNEGYTRPYPQKNTLILSSVEICGGSGCQNAQHYIYI
jgi:hypothetical protein